MNTLEQLIYSYSIKYSRKIKAVCDPLDRLLELPVFVYYRIQEDGEFCLLSNFPEQAEYYYSEKMYLTNPYLVHPRLIHPGYVLTSETPSSDYLQTLETSKQKFNLQHTFLMIRKKENAMEGFLFGTLDPKNSLYSYIHYLDPLKKFGQYFLQEMDPLLRKMKKASFSLHEAKGDLFLKENIHLPLSSKKQNIETFLSSISCLSKRERQCFELFKEGCSAQETAAKLGLSQRTIEHYFETIKRKLHCRSKRDLLSKE